METVGQTGFSFIPILKPQTQMERWLRQRWYSTLQWRNGKLICLNSVRSTLSCPFSALEIHLHL